MRTSTRTRLNLESLTDRIQPATASLSAGVLTFVGDATADVMQLSNSAGTYTLKDTGHTIADGGGLTGWTGFGTDTITGPGAGLSAIDIQGGDGNDQVNIRSANHPISITGGNGNDMVNLSSDAPTNAGNLAGVTDDVTVTGDAGVDALNVSDYTGSTANAAVVIDSGSITEFVGPTDAAAVNYSGTFSLVRVIGSNTPGIAENFTINGSGAPLRLDCNAGADTVSVLATTYTTTVYGGDGADMIGVGDAGSLAGIVGTLNVDAGSGANTLTLDDSAGGSHAVAVTSSRVQGFAPVDVNYKATGGTLTLNLDCSATAQSTVHIGPLASTTTLNLNGDWLVI